MVAARALRRGKRVKRRGSSTRSVTGGILISAATDERAVFDYISELLRKHRFVLDGVIQRRTGSRSVMTGVVELTGIVGLLQPGRSDPECV